MNEKTKTTSAKKTQKSNDGISNLLNVVFSNLGDPQSRGNASSIYNIAKMFM